MRINVEYIIDEETKAEVIRDARKQNRTVNFIVNKILEDYYKSK